MSDLNVLMNGMNEMSDLNVPMNGMNEMGVVFEYLNSIDIVLTADLALVVTTVPFLLYGLFVKCKLVKK
jgi:uncharacterized membrane protein YqhA